MPPLTSRRIAVSIGLLLAALAAAIAVCSSLGSSGYTLLDLLPPGPASGGPGSAAGQGDAATAAAMILRVRLPRILLAAITGAALGAAGAVFQAILRNPLADPYILGVSGGAALGAFAVTALGLQALVPWLPLREAASFTGAVATVAFIFLLSRVGGRIASYPMLLIGVVTNTIYLSLILFIQTVVEATRLEGVRMWLVGNVPIEGYGLIGFLALLLLAAPAQAAGPPAPPARGADEGPLVKLQLAGESEVLSSRGASAVGGALESLREPRRERA